MKRFFTFIVAAVMSLGFFATPVFADGDDDTTKKCVSTAILGNGGEVCDDGSGSSIYEILNLVVDIMSVCVGILGVIGITIVGIQYLTAGGSEEKVKKSKRRMFEIIIGIVAYVILYAALKWLLPNFTGTNQPGIIILSLLA